jgi:hypothetical protein
MKLVQFTTNEGSLIFINPSHVTSVQPFTEADETTVIHIKTSNTSTTVKESLSSVVAKLISEAPPPILSEDELTLPPSDF